MRKQKRESFMKGVTFRRIFRNNAYVLRLVWRVSPARILLQLLYSLLDFGCWVFGTVIFMRYLFGAADMNRSFQDVAVFLGCAVVGWLLVSLFSDWVKERYLLINNQKLYRELNELLFDKAATVRENVVMDEQPLDPDRAQSAARQSGFLHKLGSLPQGYETQVTKEFDTAGALLSGGEAQSLVIMRALYKDSPVMILDEPSSALDPIAEYNLNQTMFALSGDKTVITISHRLSTTKNADRIYMLEKGRIIEQGTHDELMRLNGKYAEMFNMQREKYAIA